MRYYVVDAFTDELFHGNPAGVCLLEQRLPSALMQRLAAENNLAETAFLYEGEAGYEIRWFTPDEEMDLCGHATLATAYVVLNILRQNDTHVRFQSKSGELAVQREGARYTLDFPSRPPHPVAIPEGLERGLGCRVLEAHMARDLLVLVEDEATVQALAPDFALLHRAGIGAVVPTARGTACDFVSRFFVPGASMQEDAVTGSAHCTLIPFWSGRLGKTELLARQLSARGGTLYCRDEGARVKIGGSAVCYLQGEIKL